MDRDGNSQIQMIAFAAKQVVRVNMHVDIEITVAATRASRVAALGDAKPGPRDYASGNMHRDWLTADQPSVSATHIATLEALASRPAACGTGFRKHHMPARPADLPRCLTKRAASFRRSHATGASTHTAVDLPGYHHLPINAAQRFLERHRHRCVEISARLRLPVVGRRRMQHVGKQLAECRGLGSMRRDRKIKTCELELARWRTRRRQPARRVVFAPPRRVAQRLYA